jgi:transposase InsO family protein
MSNLVQSITQQYQIKHHKSSPYHPQANGQVESTNKVLEAILTKMVQLHHKDWEDRLQRHFGPTGLHGEAPQDLHLMSWCMESRFSFPLSSK